jgi:hypothetical protein
MSRSSLFGYGFGEHGDVGTGDDVRHQPTQGVAVDGRVTVDAPLLVRVWSAER